MIVCGILSFRNTGIDESHRQERSEVEDET